MKDYQIKYYKYFKYIEAEWNDLLNNSDLSYFCSPEWHKLVLSFLQKTTLTKRLFKIQYFTVLSRNSELMLLGFFYINRFGKEKMIQFSHILGPSDYYDFVYNDKLDSSCIKKIINEIQKEYRADRVSFSMLKEDSVITKSYLNSSLTSVRKLPAVAISLPEEYDIYLKSLSKSVRQNIRTAYNRSKRDNLGIQFSVFTKKDTNKINFKALRDLYVVRNAFRKDGQNWKSKVYHKINNLFSGEIDMFDLEEIKETDFTLGILYLNQKIASYFFGFEKNGKIEINRVVLNPEYKFYSPGMILLNEYIKKGIENGLKVVDLTNGDEKYKFDLGGQLHRVYNFNLN